MKKKLPKYELAGKYPVDPSLIKYNKPSMELPSAKTHFEGKAMDLGTPSHQEQVNTYSVQELNPTFQALNALAFGVGSIADTINEHKNRNEEKQKYINSIKQPFNVRSGVENDLPIYTKYGGGLDSKKAFEILRKGTSNGQKLTDKQKKFFSAVAFHKIDMTKKAKYGLDETEGLDESQREQADIEAEAGEVFQDNQGNVHKISDDANSHEEGGVLLNNVQKVLEDTSTTRKDKHSKALRLTPSMVEDLFGLKPKTTLSHSETLEFANEHLKKQEKAAYNKILESAKFLDSNKNDKYASNSLEMNAKYIDSLPKKEDVFDVLFDHQENLKDSMNIQSDKAKYGKYIPKALYGFTQKDMDIILKAADKSGGKTSTGANNMDYTFTQDEVNAYAKQFGFRNDTNKNFQADLYDYAVKNNPDAVEAMWTKYGPTNNAVTKDKTGFVDGDPKARTMFLLGRVTDRKPHLTGSTIPMDRNRSALPVPPITIAGKELDRSNPPSYSVGTRQNQGTSKFNEPLNATDLLTETIGLLENDRIPTTLNETQLHHVTPKLLNPLPALQAGQRDFNAAISKLPSGSGAGMANAVNAFSQKYAMDSNIIGQYDNSNNQIENQARYYNAGVDDRQSAADAQSREQFERKQLGSIEAQRQQKMTYLDSIMTKIAQNRALNRNGNLIMQTAPNFDQNAQYNGNQRYVTNPTGIPEQGNTGLKYMYDSNGNRFRYIIDSKGNKILVEDKKIATK